MTSGVYELKFSNGDRYIGKSIDIENRWKQHMDKFKKGTAARAMQHAFNTWGPPEGDVLCRCHSDHIDILEACYIARHRPELNSDRPSDPFQGVDEAVLNNLLQNTNIFQGSTWDHITVISNLIEERNELAEEVAELEELNDSLLRKRSKEEINAESASKLRDTKNVINLLNMELINAKDEIIKLNKSLAYEKLPWWKKLF